jgi:hypothetical protein
MLIQEVIEKAREGGYTPYQCNDRSYAVLEHYFLDTSFWESLGRTMGWKGDFERKSSRWLGCGLMGQGMFKFFDFNTPELVTIFCGTAAENNTGFVVKG